MRMSMSLLNITRLLLTGLMTITIKRNALFQALPLYLDLPEDTILMWCHLCYYSEEKRLLHNLVSFRWVFSICIAKLMQCKVDRIYKIRPYEGCWQKKKECINRLVYTHVSFYCKNSPSLFHLWTTMWRRPAVYRVARCRLFPWGWDSFARGGFFFFLNKCSGLGGFVYLSLLISDIKHWFITYIYSS